MLTEQMTNERTERTIPSLAPISTTTRLAYALIVLVVLIAASAAAAAPSTLSGVVLDGDSHRPILGAVVRVVGLDHAVQTDSAGQFAVMLDHRAGSDHAGLHVTHVAYDPATVEVDGTAGADRRVAIYLTPRSPELPGITVSGQHDHPLIEELNEQSLHGKALDRELGQTLAGTLKNETGLALRSMGPAPARPVIRGFGGDRVMISEDGNKTSDLSATSPDHAVTIEPFALERIEVVRGPRVLLQTPTTFGGVVNAVRHEIPDSRRDGVLGVLGAYGETANDGYLGSLVLEVPLDAFVLRGESNGRSADDVDTPVGRLNNSYADTRDYSVGASWFGRGVRLGGSMREFDLDYGIPGGFVGGHPMGVDIDMLKRQYNVELEYNLPGETFTTLSAHGSRVYYRHKEFEADGSIGSEFRTVSYLGHVNLDHAELGFLQNGTWGVSLESRDFEIGGYVFTPPTKAINVAGYLFESWQWERFSLEFGGRVNYDRLRPEYDDPDASIGYIRTRSFGTWSVSVSGLYSLTDQLFAGVNLSRSSRVPTIEELYNEGPHLAAYSYETGNPDLDAESGLGSELFVYHRSGRLFALATAFYDDLDGFIVPRNTGRLNYQTLLPIYSSQGVSARLYGVESQVRFQICRTLGRQHFGQSHPRGVRRQR